MKKIKIYITLQQALIILIPLSIILAILFDLNIVMSDLRKILIVKRENFKISKERIFNALTSNRDKINIYQKSLMDMDRHSTIWLLKYGLYKEDIKDGKNIKFTQYIALAKSKNPDEILNNLNNANKIDKNKFFKSLESEKIEDNKKLNQSLKFLKLQMILVSNKIPKVIINNKILKIGDKIRDAKIIKILRDRVLIKSTKEEKWLKLID